MRSGLSFYGAERPSLLLGSGKILGIRGDLLAFRSLALDPVVLLDVR